MAIFHMILLVFSKDRKLNEKEAANYVDILT